MPRIKPTEPSTVAIVRAADVSLAWTSEGVRRAELPHGHPDEFFAVWQDGLLSCLTPSHSLAVEVALLQAAEQHHIVDLVTDKTLLAGHVEWLPWPREPVT